MKKVIFFVMVFMLCCSGCIPYVNYIPEETTEEKTTEEDTVGETKVEEIEVEKIYVDPSEIDSVYANPDEYEGKYIKISGKVFGEPESYDGEVFFQMYADAVNAEKNTVVYLKGSIDVNSDEFVIVDGLVKGDYQYTNMFGGELSALYIEAETVEKSNYIECCAPTIKEITVNETIDQHGYSVTVEKIEFAESETRLYITVANNGTENFTVYDSSIKIVQNQSQYEYDYNFDANYQDLQSDLLPGTSSSGIVSFPALDPEKELVIYCDSYCDDWNLDFEDYVFEINTTE